MINLNALNHSILINKPFKYACINQFISEVNAEQLRSQLPEGHYYRSTRAGGSDKTYNVVNSILFNLEKQTTQDFNALPEPWKALLNALTSDEYRVRLEHLLNENLSNCYREITLKVYKKGDFLSYHTDKSDVKATHMIFFNENWDDHWGGQLVFSDARNNEAFVKFNPLWMHSVAFVRADNSWHSVLPIVTDEDERIALQVAFWNIKKREVLPGRIEETLNAYD
jgi:Rps23 Pro-64 3,4-dihydroxylase Tpa1-like proline 4-hydroxylase